MNDLWWESFLNSLEVDDRRAARIAMQFMAIEIRRKYDGY